MTNRVSIRSWGWWGLVLSCVVSCGLGACKHPGVDDPVATDPVPFDAAHPPRLAETTFRVEGASLPAIVYEAQGQGPHPTVILLHGFPGNEKNLDLAQAIRRAGWNVVFFHYRGSWGSGGRFSFGHVLEDVAAVVAAIARPDFATAHRIDPERVVLIGHSMGGFAALVTASEQDVIGCVASLAGGNLGGLAKRAAAAIDAREAGAPIDNASGASGASGAPGPSGVRADSNAETMAARLDAWSGPIRGASGAELVAEIAAQAERFDTTRHAPRLARKPVLLIAGRLDVVAPVTQHHDPMVDALREAGAVALEAVVFEDADHSFSGQRIALARRVTRWLAGACAGAGADRGTQSNLRDRRPASGARRAG